PESRKVTHSFLAVPDNHQRRKEVSFAERALDQKNVILIVLGQQNDQALAHFTTLHGVSSGNKWGVGPKTSSAPSYVSLDFRRVSPGGRLHHGVSTVRSSPTRSL